MADPPPIWATRFDKPFRTISVSCDPQDSSFHRSVPVPGNESDKYMEKFIRGESTPWNPLKANTGRNHGLFGASHLGGLEDSGYGGSGSWNPNGLGDDYTSLDGFLGSALDLETPSLVSPDGPSNLSIGHVGPVKYSEPLFCDICKTNVKTKAELKKHQQRHSKPYRCSYSGCTRTQGGFSTHNDLDRHIRSVHMTPQRQFKCDLGTCKQKEKFWPREDYFRQHLRRVHHLVDFKTIDVDRFIVKHSPSEPLVETPGWGGPPVLAPIAPESGGAAAESEETLPVRETNKGLDTYTDSGYGSHGAKTVASASTHCQTRTVRGSAVNQVDSDAQTVYSDTASLQDPRIDEYVIAFADELSNALPPDFSREELEAISDTLPDILEAFAGRIGYQASGKLERQLKHLVHRYRR